MMSELEQEFDDAKRALRFLMDTKAVGRFPSVREDAITALGNLVYALEQELYGN